MSKGIFRPFSIRHQKALREKKIRPSLPKKLRMRLWYIIEEFDYSMLIQPDPNNSWNETTTVLAELPNELLKIYGTNKLEAFVDDSGMRKEVKIKEFVLGAYPAQVLDVIEMVCNGLVQESYRNIHVKINQVMKDGNCPWVLSDGQFVLMDSSFFESEVLERANELLSINLFQGAKEEFLEARNDFTVGDYKGSIHNACKAFESVMKGIENRTDGTASDLIKGLDKIGFYERIPEPIKDGFANQILSSVPYLRNRLGGHGQGSEIVDVPNEVAKLTLHLSASLIIFLMEHHLELTGQGKTIEEESKKEPNSDDIPF